MAGTGNQAIDHHFELVYAAMIDIRRLLHVVGSAVHAHADKAGPANLIPKRLVFLLPAALQRRHHVELRAFGQAGDVIDDFVCCLRADGDIAGRAVRLAQPGIEDTQVIINFRHGADGRARALAGRLLFDADRRRQAGYVIDLWLLHLPQELARVCGE